MMLRKLFLPVLFALLIIVSCGKDKPMYSDIPSITRVDVHPSLVNAYKDSIEFIVSYEDGDGDLGENDPSVSNLYLVDNRIGITYPFRIPQLAPDGSKLIIRGSLSVVLNNTGITDGSSSQTVTYSIYMKDRAGNTSNTVTTNAITVNQ